MRSILIIILCSVSYLALGQTMSNISWKKKRSIADDFFLIGDFNSAGQYYRSAWKSKTSIPELAYKAGISFMKVRDYKSAAQSLEPIQGNRDDFMDAGYLYGVALKYSGKYDKAIAAFTSHIEGYTGEDINDLKYKAEQQIKGCKLGKSWETNGGAGNDDFVHLGNGVNTGSVEFGPRAMGENKFIFSSVVNGMAKIYSSEFEGEKWSKRKVFPIGGLEMPHYGNGSFTPDLQRFYFTQCDVDSKMETYCAIFVVEKNVNTYSSPVQLSSKINVPGSTSTHPFVYVDGNMEILLFTSDRPGGEGGNDIWYTIKKKGTPDDSFLEPENLGPKINTPDDETTPYYDRASKILYFSSDGHVSGGGYDIFKSKGFRTTWEKPENLGAPYNSSADDLYYSLVPDSENAFFVSNRMVSPHKMTTNSDDIFTIGSSTPGVIVSGFITDASDEGEILDDVNVTLFEILKDGSLNSVKTDNFKDGNYEFTLKPQKEYRIEAQKSGFMNAFFDMKTYDVPESITINQNVPLEAEEVAAIKEKEADKPKLTESDISVIIPDGNIPIPEIKLSEAEEMKEPELELEEDLEVESIAAELPELETEVIKLDDPKLPEPEVETPVLEVETPEVETPVVSVPEVEIPDVEVETPAVAVETPVVTAPELETPALKVETPEAETPVVPEPEVENPAVAVETPVVTEPEIETPVLEVETPEVETPIVSTPEVETPTIEVETPAVAVETPVVTTPEIETPIVSAPEVETPTVEVEMPAVAVEMPVVTEPEIEAPALEVETPALKVDESVETPIVATPEIETPAIEVETPTVVVETPSVSEPAIATPSVEIETPAATVETPVAEVPEIEVSTIETPAVAIESPVVSEPIIETPSIVEAISTKEVVRTEISTPVYSTPAPSIVYVEPSVPTNRYFTGEVDSRIYDYPGNAKANFDAPRVVTNYESAPTVSYSSDSYVTDSDVTGIYSGSTYSEPISYSSPEPVYSEPVYSEPVYSEPITYSEPTTTSSSTYESASALSQEYKIQIAAVFEYNPVRYSPVEALGKYIALEDVETESGGMIRVLIDGFTSATEAKDYLAQVQGNGFPRAFMIRYDNGVRIPRTMRR